MSAEDVSGGPLHIAGGHGAEPPGRFPPEPDPWRGAHSLAEVELRILSED